MNDLIKQHVTKLIDSAQSGQPIFVRQIIGTTLVKTDITDSSQLEELSDYELGYLYGYTRASQNIPFTEVLNTLLVDSVPYKKGVYDGYLNEAQHTDHVPDSTSLRKLIKDYVSGEKNFIQILDSYQALKDAKEEKDYQLLKQGEDYQLGVKYSKENLQAVEEDLSNNKNHRILGVDENGDVIVGEKESEVVSDASVDDYSLKKVNNKHYEVLKNGVHTYDLEQKQSNWTCNCTGFKYRNKCKHIGLLNDVLPKRRPLPELEAAVPMIKATIEPLFGPMLEGNNGGKWSIVGSYRRKKSTVKDVDIIVETDKSTFIKLLDVLKQDPNYEHTMAGPDIIRGKYQGWDFDVTRVEPGEWGSYLLYRTGDANFNMKMRALAKKKGWRLNEHGLFDSEGNVIANESEESIFKALGMPYIKPEDRE